MPTATSVRPVPAKLLEVNRLAINDHLSRTTGGKVSFTHLIAWAVVKALGAVPEMNASFVPALATTGTAGLLRHEHVGLGLAIDYEKADGSRTLYVPCIRAADTLDFSEFLRAYEDLVRKVRTNRLSVDDFAGVTVTVTNPGTLGTTQSVPRLMSGQGAIIGVGALGYPAEFAATDPAVIAELGMSKVVTDHLHLRPPHHPGRPLGAVLVAVHELLVGEHGFYDEIFSSLGVPSSPARWHSDVNPDRLQARRSTAASSSRPRCSSSSTCTGSAGHLIADLDPLGTVAPALHPELDPAHLRAHHLRPRPELCRRGPRRGDRAPAAPGCSRSCATPTAERSASSTCTSKTPSRSGGSSTMSRACPRTCRRASSTTCSSA